MPHTLLSVHASNRIGTSACSKRTEVCNMSFQTDQTQTVQIICQTGINQLSPATYHSLKYISLVCEQTSTNNAKPRNADIRQHLLATQSQFLHLMTLPAQCDRFGSLHVAPSHSGSLCHLLGMSFHIESTMPAAKTADKKACAQTLYASMLNSIADFRESRLIPWTDFAVFHHKHTKINWVIQQLGT